MNTKRNVLIGLGIFLFVSGNIVNLLFSSNLLWGEMEARLFTSQAGGKNLGISCPLIIAPWESADITTIVTNTTTKATKPQVNLFVSDKNDARVESQTLELESFESQPMKWTVDSSDIVFERLILVSVLQRQYRELESRQSTCSIYVFSLFGMNGQGTLITILEIGVLTSLLGIGLLYYALHPFSAFAKKIIPLNILFLVIVLAGLFSALPRLWGLTLFFNATALLSVVVGYTEILFSKK